MESFVPRTARANAKPAKRVRRSKVSQNDLAYEKLKHLITTLAYKPGDSVNITDLMHDLAIGRTPINHALHRLSSDGLVHIIPRKGVIVAPLSIDNALEIIEVRIANESLCARLAAAKITETELAELDRLLDEFETAVKRRDVVAAIAIDRFFHEQIAAASKNSVLADYLKVIHALSQRFWATSLSSEEHLLEVFGEHRAIYEALAAGDAGKAVAAVEDHVESFRRSLLKIR
jgi:DNA-binding GntR family transcriptional regulator